MKRLHAKLTAKKPESGGDVGNENDDGDAGNDFDEDEVKQVRCCSA